MNELATIPPKFLEANDELQQTGGLFLDRQQMRKLYNRLMKLDANYPDQPGLKLILAQLRGALDRKGWKKMAISASGAGALSGGGLVIGIIQ